MLVLQSSDRITWFDDYRFVVADLGIKNSQLLTIKYPIIKQKTAPLSGTVS